MVVCYNIINCENQPFKNEKKNTETVEEKNAMTRGL